MSMKQEQKMKLSETGMLIFIVCQGIVSELLLRLLMFLKSNQPRGLQVLGTLSLPLFVENYKKE